MHKDNTKTNKTEIVLSAGDLAEIQLKLSQKRRKAIKNNLRSMEISNIDGTNILEFIQNINAIFNNCEIDASNIYVSFRPTWASTFLDFYTIEEESDESYKNSLKKLEKMLIVRKKGEIRNNISQKEANKRLLLETMKQLSSEDIYEVFETINKKV